MQPRMRATGSRQERRGVAQEGVHRTVWVPGLSRVIAKTTVAVPSEPTRCAPRSTPSGSSEALTVLPGSRLWTVAVCTSPRRVVASATVPNGTPATIGGAGGRLDVGDTVAGQVGPCPLSATPGEAAQLGAPPEGAGVPEGGGTVRTWRAAGDLGEP